MLSPTSSEQAGQSLGAGLRDSLSERLDRAFRAEELAATKRATWVSVVAIAGIAALVFALVPADEARFYYVVLAGLAVMSIVHLALRRRSARRWHSYAFALVLFSIFTFAAFAPNPFDPSPWPPQMVHRLGWFVFSFIFLLPFVFSYSPLLVIWAGVCCVGTWVLGVAWLYSLPGTVTGIDPMAASDPARQVAMFLDPQFVSRNIWIQNVVVMLIVAGGLAVLVARARHLVYRQANAERQRTNLARYFSPKVVERLANVDEALGTVRSQPVAVMFADIVGFTRIAEHIAPDRTIALLRDFHQRLEQAVFDHGGTLDKFLGDGIMATFGTPETGPEDAVASIRCARAMLDSMEAWNAERIGSGEPAIHLSIGIHHGPATVGNIGSSRRLEFAVLGDVVNVSSRIEGLTRRLGCQLLVSDALYEVARREAGDAAETLLKGFDRCGAQEIRGRDEGIGVWSWSGPGGRKDG